MPLENNIGGVAGTVDPGVGESAAVGGEAV